MALVAFNGNVFALQRVFGCVVLFHAEKRWLPSIHGMAFRALALLGSRFELAFVRVRFMTIIAMSKRELPFEITLQMALSAADHGVLSEERVLGLGMVEFKARQQFFPSLGGVTFFATLLEGAFVRIDMAVDAGLELHVPVACRAARHIRLMALLALDLYVKTRQRIAGLGVIELLRRLPIHVVMTLQTIVPELTFVHIFVARYAILRQPEKGLRKIFHFDERTFIGNHEGGQVTFLASNARVLSLQLVARHTVIKLFLRSLPMDQVEILAVVFQVATDAVFAIGIPHLKLGVIAVLCFQPFRYFFMAIQALESRRAGAELVAGYALGGSGQTLMGFRKRAGGDLCACGKGEEEQRDNAGKKTTRPCESTSFAG